MRSRSAALLFAALTALPATALAQTPDVVVETEANPNLDTAQLEDPNVDRGMLLPTAQTQPKGTIAFNDYELFFMGVSYGATDDLQLTATTLVPITTDVPLFLLTNAKYRLVSSGRLRLAAIGGLGVFDAEPSFDGESEEVTVLTLTGGAAATICLSEDCHSMASATITASKGFSDGDESGLGFIYGGSVIARTSKRTKIVVEATSAAGLLDGDLENADGALLTYGVRFFSQHIAGDIGFLRPLGMDEDGEDSEFLLGIPFVTFTYRQ